MAELYDSVRVVPSILAADFGRLSEQVAEVLDAGAKIVHIDVMDGHFVPPITVGPLVVGALRELASSAGAALEAHLMIERPERQISEFAKAGADAVTVHAEATPNLAYAVDRIRSHGMRAGVAINPATPPAALAEVEGIGVALCMTVNPGWGGQPFIGSSVAKIGRLREAVGAEVPVEVDGGIDPESAPRCREAGARLFVAGSAVFGSGDPGGAYRTIVEAVGAA